MLNRRYIRIKVMQALYAFFTSGNTDIKNGETELSDSNKGIYELYIRILSIYKEFQEIAVRKAEQNKKKFIPSKEDLNPNLRFVYNPILISLNENDDFHKQLMKNKVDWNLHSDLIIKMFHQLCESEYFNLYMKKPEVSFDDHKDILLFIMKNFIEPSDVLPSIFEETSIHWVEGFYYACEMAQKTIEKSTDSKGIKLMSLYKDIEEDVDFFKQLYRKSIMNKGVNERIIVGNSSNWEFERIALMDLILMNMAITEAVEFPSIPVKVTLNEYIELSKLYSSSKSKLFINGILDKVFSQLQNEGKIKKAGRGLKE